MAIKHNEVNPLAVHGIRRLDFCPPHFEKAVFDRSTSEKVISDWIYENTDGRFYFGLGPSGSNNSGVMVGFELPAECSYFVLMLPTFNTVSIDDLF